MSQHTKLSVTVDEIEFKNPILVGSGPPSASFNNIKRAQNCGFGGAVIKTVSPDSEAIVNVAPRYGKLVAPGTDFVMGFENIELIATEPLSHWIDIVKQMKDLDPEFVMITSLMAPCDRPDEWAAMIEAFEEAGTDGFEINASCPHGFADRKNGSGNWRRSEDCRRCLPAGPQSNPFACLA